MSTPSRISSAAAGVADAFRGQLWPTPVAGVVAAFVAGVAMVRLDRSVDGHLPGWLAALTFSGGPDAARSVLDAIGSSLITVTSLTFSLTVVTLQLASSQFSPRLLRTFNRDRFVQVTLALFLATFVYSLTVLRAVRGPDGPGGGIVPRLAITLGFLLALASVVALVLFLAHLTTQIRAESMLRTVHREATSTIAHILDRRDEPSVTVPTVPDDPRDTVTVPAPESGFVVRWDAESALDVAETHDLVVRVTAWPGTFAVEGTPIAAYWSRSGLRLDPEVVAEVTAVLAAAAHLGFERTSSQDVAYGLRQLTDVANKALSPGINDPTTAVHALGHLSALLCDLGDRDLGTRVLACDDVARVLLEGPGFAELVDEALSQPRRYGAGDPVVLRRIVDVLADLAHRVPSALCDVVRSELSRVERTVAAQDFDSVELGQLADAADRVRETLARRTHGVAQGPPT